MAESKNPYESPENSELATKGPVADLQYQFDARFMLSLIMATALLGGLDYAALEVGFFVVFGPPILFFCIAFWSIMAGTRSGTMEIGFRIMLGVFGGVLAAPCFELLLVFTCTPVAEFSGAHFDIHGGGIFGSIQQKIIFSLITAGFIGGVGFLCYWLLYLAPRMFAASQKFRTTGSRES